MCDLTPQAILNKSLGSCLKNFRESLDLGQRDFMNRYQLKASQTTFSRWESGLQGIPLYILFDLEILDLNPIFAARLGKFILNKQKFLASEAALINQLVKNMEKVDKHVAS